MKLKTALLLFPCPLDPGNGPAWKMSGDALEVRDGHPVYIAADGTESTFDISSLPRLNAEARAHRERAEKLAKDMKAFEGIDPEKAREALQHVQDLGDKKLIDAGEIEKVRARVSEEWGKKYTTVETENQALKNQIQTLVMDNAFTGSKFVSEKLNIPADMAQAAFGKFFKYEDGKLVAYGPDGGKLYSAKNPNAEIDFEEAIQLLVASYPHRDRILKAPDHSGGGGSGGGGRGGSRTMTRGEFEKLPPMEQAARAKDMRDGKLVLID